MSCLQSTMRSFVVGKNYDLQLPSSCLFLMLLLHYFWCNKHLTPLSNLKGQKLIAFKAQKKGPYWILWETVVESC